jgi:hypothetical protein
MTKKMRKFIEQVLSGELPPANPLKLKNWAGLAFDRNQYVDFAPPEFWASLFKIQRIVNGKERGIEVIQGMDAQRFSEVFRPTTLEDLRKYWTTDAKFLRNHYVVSEKEDWVVRLDQDVTLFAAVQSFASMVVNDMGGLEAVMCIMSDDFGVSENSDNLGLQGYLKEITKPLRPGL